jgi:hypothetical protein
LFQGSHEDGRRSISSPEGDCSVFGFLFIIINWHIGLILLVLVLPCQAVIKKKYGQDATNVGDEGGFAPNIQASIVLVACLNLILQVKADI